MTFTARCNRGEESIISYTENYISIGSIAGNNFYVTNSFQTCGDYHIKAVGKNTGWPNGMIEGEKIHIHIIVPGIYSATVENAQANLQIMKDSGLIPYYKKSPIIKDITLTIEA